MFGRGALCALVLTVAIICGQRGSCEGQKGSAKNGDQGSAASKANKSREAEAENLIYARVSKERGFSHPNFPYVLHVESIKGRKLQGIQFMRRDKTGKGYDMVGKASEAELRVDLAHQVILVRMRHGGFFFEDEDTEETAGFSDWRVHEVALPPDWRDLVTKSSRTAGKDEPRVSAKAKAFLAEDLFPSKPREEDRKLRLAFGDNCQELKATIKLVLASRGLVLAADTFNIEEDGRLKFTPCSIALFSAGDGDATAPPITTIRSVSAFLQLDRPINTLWALGDRKIVSVELAGGMRVVLNKQ